MNARLLGCGLAAAALVLAGTASAASAASTSVSATDRAYGGEVGPTIIGGDPATEQYGFAASLQYKDPGERPSPHRCGGALVAAQWVVTAAHCIAGLDGTLLNPADFTVAIGSNDNQAGTKIDAAQFIAHPYWAAGQESAGDIGLIKLSAPSSETPINNILHPGRDETVRMIGWGRTVEDDPASMPREILQLDTKLLLHADCKFGDEFDATPGDVCVSRAKNDTAGACNGDSGSPLLWKVDGVWRIVGVDSRSGGETGCLNTPEVYTTTDFYWSWVKETVNARAG
jgi:secreted trypsin-like serine protease